MNQVANKKSSSSLETFDRMMKFPLVESAWHQSQGVYGKVKNSNSLVNWALNSTEGAIQRTAAVAAPLVHKLDGPIQLVDRTVVKGIDKLETTAPIIKETPQQIYEQTRTRVLETVQPHYEMVCALTAVGHEKAATLKEISVKKVNEVLTTKYGSKAVTGLDSTSALAEKMLDYCFPAAPSNDAQQTEEDDTPISAEENPVMHTIQTVGRLSNKVTRRVYSTVLRQVEVIRKQDVQEYITALIAILRITRYLNLVNQTENVAVTQENAETGEISPKQQ